MDARSDERLITAIGGIIMAVKKGQAMPYEPPFERNDAIDTLCMEIAELVGMISPKRAVSAAAMSACSTAMPLSTQALLRPTFPK